MEIFRLVFSPIEVNTYVLADRSGDCAIIDCGCYDKAETEEFAEFIKKKNLNPVLLINTHCHLDHIFGNKFILEKYKLKALSSEFDEMNRINSVQQAHLFGLTMDDPSEPGEFIIDNQVITFGTTELIALHVPGHSPGSMAFYSEKNGCVFTGDALFSGSIGRTDLPTGNSELIAKSIKEKLYTLDDDFTVYPGHGPTTTIGQEKLTNPYVNA